MPIAARVAPHLPRLRRFGRMVTGSQQVGDAAVERTLTALIADPSSFPQDLPDRLATFKIFLRTLSKTASMPKTSPAETSIEAPDRKLAAIAPLPRQAFLLQAVEGFAPEHIACVMDVPPSDVLMLLHYAGREISEQMTTDILIIEDEPVIAMDIESMARDLGHRVVGIARTHAEAVEIGRVTMPGLVLADISLADGSSGLEAVNELLSLSAAPVIFITAYPERLLTGDKPEPAFLVAKPFHPETVRATISQALFFDQKASLRADRAAH